MVWAINISQNTNGDENLETSNLNQQSKRNTVFVLSFW